jgi:hypothetical protein
MLIWFVVGEAMHSDAPPADPDQVSFLTRVSFDTRSASIGLPPHTISL